MLSRFIDYITIERHYSAHTARAYQHDLEEFALYLGVEPEHLDLNKVDEDDVRDWMITLMDQGITPRSVKRKLSSLHSYAKYCLKIGTIQKDPTLKIIAPKMDKPLPVFYKDSEMEALRQTEQYADDFVSKRDNLILEMLYQTGMRQAELIGLNDADIDLRQLQIRVFGKRRKERLIPIGSSLSEQITEYQEIRDAELQQNDALSQRDGFFCSEKGKRITRSQVYKVVHERMSEVSTLKKQSPHVLRHTFATTMLNNGADINTIKTLMGHASLAATQVYTHTTFEQIKEVYQSAHPRSK